MKYKYKHKEAYCLMWYACKCGHRERVWNSRDGVTPFGMSCPSCESDFMKGQGLKHERFHLDECVPEHQPHEGQLIFRDGTIKEAVAIIERRYKAMHPDGNYPPNKDTHLKEVAEGKDGEFNPGWPMSYRSSNNGKEQ